MNRWSATAQANGISIAWQAVGPLDGEVVLIIAGLGGQMTAAPDPLSEGLAARGFRAIRFDNRDIGLSTHLDAAGPPPDHEAILSAVAAGEPPPVAYTLQDMAADAIGLLDALGVEKAHIVGGSMGGMIGQIVAADYPDRVLSFASIMSTTGNPEIPLGPAIGLLTSTVGADGTDEEILDRKVALFQALEGQAYRSDPKALREKLRLDLSRANDPLGVARQSAATVPDSDRRGKLTKITAPTVVIHGSDDPIFPPAHAEDQVAHIGGALLKIIQGMGHDLPAEVVPQVLDAVVANAARAGNVEPVLSQ